jgi:hypothetical protein
MARFRCMDLQSIYGDSMCSVVGFPLHAGVVVPGFFSGQDI